jgi:hypothetical protein
MLAVGLARGSPRRGGSDHDGESSADAGAPEHLHPVAPVARGRGLASSLAEEADRPAPGQTRRVNHEGLERMIMAVDVSGWYSGAAPATHVVLLFNPVAAFPGSRSQV